jgi:DNA-3-methyladenine glycosylase II
MAGGHTTFPDGRGTSLTGGIVRVTPAAPFDFELTAGHHASYQTYYGPHLLRDGAYTRLLEAGGTLVLASARSQGTVEEPALEITVSGQVGEEESRSAAESLASALGCEEQLGGFYSLTAGDPVMARLVRGLYGLHSSRTSSVFEALVTSITAQQIASNVARLIRSLLVERYGRHFSMDGRSYYAFPTPESLLAAGVEGLREAKLSTRKAEYILEIASRAVDGSLERWAFEGLPDQELEQRFTGLRGVGKWTWQWLQVRALGRPDGFPSGDLALRRNISGLYFSGRPVSESEVEEFSRRWSPFRSLATLYLFAGARLGLLPP